MTRSLRFALLAVALTACTPEDGVKITEVPEPPVERPTFDGTEAHRLIQDQVAFGPRIPGTQGHADQLAWMENILGLWADEVQLQAFEYTTTGGIQLSLTNVLARFRPELTDRILLMAHWDTRPRSDQASDPADRNTPVPGANDGGSGTAILLHLSELMSANPPPLGVDVLFFDGEDYGPWVPDMFIGSEYFAENLPNPIPWRYGILLDMVGDLDPNFPIEGYSAEYALHLAQEIWQIAEDLGFSAFFPKVIGQRILDDHIPMNQAGLQTVDIIDFEYGPSNSLWHTPDDVPENTSAETLRMVGETLTELVYRGG